MIEANEIIRMKGKQIQPKICIPSQVLRILSMFSKAIQYTRRAPARQIREESKMKATGIVRRIDDLGRVVTTLEQWERFCGGMLGLERRMGWNVHTI